MRVMSEDVKLNTVLLTDQEVMRCRELIGMAAKAGQTSGNAKLFTVMVNLLDNFMIPIGDEE